MQSNLEEQSPSKRHIVTLGGSCDGHRKKCKINAGDANTVARLRPDNKDADTAPDVLWHDSMTLKHDTIKVFCLLKYVWHL